ncbi:hypothetical protein JJC03_14805 [Flavobacterium oreochromis]|uniref:hypothetical protein n=1 Tax=Flavobacterium oreochromis TaxID=2906078 RepID=UPI001CE5ACE0|nr:hypothetical protein [Flavobacterium oreochromis]QYS86209.1 hypothetical protein JJC03_14805 [Flavobacterium oreochromis]
MEKDLIINKLIHNGYTVDLTLQDDCLYCANTDTLYILNSFTVDQEITFSDHNNKKE